MKLGTATSVFFHNSLEDAIPIIAEAGYDGVDIWGGRPHVYRGDYSKSELQTLKKLIADHNLEVSSFMPAFYRYPHSLSNPNPRVRKDSIDYMCVCMENAVALGAPILLVVPDHSLIGQSTRDSFQRMIDSIGEVASFGAQYNIKLGIEILHEAETDIIKSSADALYIIDQLDCERIGVVIDTGAINLSPEPYNELITKLGDKLLQVHINDNNGKKQQNLVPGDGTFDFKGLIKLLKSMGFEGFLSAELSKDFCNNPGPELQTTAQRVKKWLE